MKRALAYTGTGLAAGAIVLGAAGVAQAKLGTYLDTQYHSVKQHHTGWFRGGVFSDSAQDHIGKGLKFCLQQQVPAAHHKTRWVTLKCTTDARYPGKGEVEFVLSERFDHRGTFVFRGVAYKHRHGSVWKQYGPVSNTTQVRVK